MEIKNKKEWIKESKAEVLPLLCCTECEAKISSCSACGKCFEPHDEIGCSIIPDRKHYCETCTAKLNKEANQNKEQKDNTQVFNPKLKRWVKIDTQHGRILQYKKSLGKFKDIKVLREKGVVSEWEK